jgi:hypothetical protein
VKSDLPYPGPIVDSITAIEANVAGGSDAFTKQRTIQTLDLQFRGTRAAFAKVKDAAARYLWGEPRYHNRTL